MPEPRWKPSVRNRKYRARKKAGLTRLVSEGDSWFGYPLYRNIIDYIDDTEKYAIRRFEENGDTLKNMIDRGEFLPAIHKEKPVVLLFSGGGNDLVERALLEALFNNKQPGMGPADLINRAVWDAQLATFTGQYERLVVSVDRNVPIITHGYDHFVPSDEGVRLDGFTLTGPWAKPVMVSKGIVDPQDQRGIGRIVIDDFYAMLNAVAAKFPGRLHVVDGRGAIDPNSGWANEMHPRAAGFKEVASRFLATLSTVIP